jgi:hypothetical protein
LIHRWQLTGPTCHICGIRKGDDDAAGPSEPVGEGQVYFISIEEKTDHVNSNTT